MTVSALERARIKLAVRAYNKFLRLTPEEERLVDLHNRIPLSKYTRPQGWSSNRSIT